MKQNPGDIIISHKCPENCNHMLYCSWDMTCDRCNCYFSFWAIFCPFTPLTAQKNKIKKKGKDTCRYHNFTYVYLKLWSYNVQFLRYGAQWTDGWTDRRKKWHVEVGAPPKNKTANIYSKHWKTHSLHYFDTKVFQSYPTQSHTGIMGVTYL